MYTKGSNNVQEKIKAYDWCVTNKDFDGKQYRVDWHDDYLEISHVIPAEVSKFILLIEEELGNEKPMNKHQGKTHKYLG